MTKKDQKDFEKWAMPKLERLQKTLLLSHFTPLALQYKKPEKGEMASCRFSYPYQSITIAYHDGLLDYFKKKRLKDILDIFTHEMVHPLTDPLYSVGFDRFVTKEALEAEREKLTDHIANILITNKLV